MVILASEPDAMLRYLHHHNFLNNRQNEMGGPAGCLQFFTGATGTVNTFNWATVTTSKCLKSTLQQYAISVIP